MRPASVCVLPLYRVKTDVSKFPARVSRALQYTRDMTGYVFTRMPQERLPVTNSRTSNADSALRTHSDGTASRSPSTSRLTLNATSTGNQSCGMCSLELDGSPSVSSICSQTSDSGSISLVPGVFQSKKPRPRIILRYRQLSSEERVIQWLYKSCTRPTKTLPLL